MLNQLFRDDKRSHIINDISRLLLSLVFLATLFGCDNADINAPDNESLSLIINTSAPSAVQSSQPESCDQFIIGISLL